jgi:hypothetical protein
MARISLQEPITFSIRPIDKGLNSSDSPQGIHQAETPNTMNSRFFRGLTQSRSGFKSKYKGLRGAALWIDVVYDAGNSVPVAFTQGALYKESGDIFSLVDWYEAAAASSYPYYSVDPATQFLSVDIGEGKFDFTWANAGAVFPASGDYADIMAAVVNGDVYIITYTGQGTGVEVEKLDDGARVGVPTGARCCVFFDESLVVATNAGGSNYATIQWSAKGRPDWWDTAVYDDAGSAPIGDSPDWIQNMKRLGEYLIVYKERSIYVGRKSLLSDPRFYFDPAPGQGIGLAAPNSVGDLGEEHLFLGWDDVYTFSAKGLTPIGTRVKSELFYGGNGILPEYIHTVDGIIAEEWDEYWLFVPSGKWPEAFNCMRNPTMQDLDDDDTLDDYWTITADGDGAGSYEAGGNFGNGEFIRISKTTGNYVILAGEKYDFNASIHGKKFSAVVYLKGSDTWSGKIRIVTFDSGGANPTYHDLTITNREASETFERIIFSAIISDADAEQVRLHIYLGTSDVNLDIDAAQLVDITDIPTEQLYEENGYHAPAYIGPDNAPIMIPLITGDWAFDEATPHDHPQIGPWLADTLWVYNYEKDAWSAWRLPVTGFGYDTFSGIVTIADLEGTVAEQSWRFDERRIEAFAPTNLVGEPDGNIYEVSGASTKDWEGIPGGSVPVLFFWESKDFDLDRPTIVKTVSKVVLHHETNHPATTVTVGVSLDSGLAWTEQEVTIRNGYTETYADVFVTGPQFRLRFKSESPMYIQGFSVKLIPRGESFAAS